MRLSIQIALYRKIKSAYGSLLLQSIINNIEVWCMSDYMQPNFNKTSWHGFDYTKCELYVTRTACIGDLGVLTDTNLHFHQQVDNIFSQVIGLLGLIHNVTIFCWSPHGFLTLYCTWSEPKLYIPLLCGILSLPVMLVS